MDDIGLHKVPPNEMTSLAKRHLTALTAFPHRAPGSAGNVAATDHVAAELHKLGWQVETPEFELTAWRGGGSSLQAGPESVPIQPSPYGLGISQEATLVEAGDRERLDLLASGGHAAGQVLLLHGELTREPLAPENYPFYRIPGHDELRAALLRCDPAAIIAVTGRAPGYCGAVEPFPLIEDGRFPIPVADVPLSAGEELRRWSGRRVSVRIQAKRWQVGARNVVARRGSPGPRAVVTAHLDTKPNTPGALDNATGVVVLLLTAALLTERTADDGRPVELVAFNGEDHFSAAGEIDYLQRNGGPEAPLDGIRLVVNTDAAGHRGHATAWSTYNLDDRAIARVRATLARPGLAPGEPWWQGDHAVFAQRGRPAVAFTSASFEQLLDEVIHTPRDTTDLVDLTALVALSRAVADLACLPDLG